VANLLWIQGAGCGGETASLLNSDHPQLQTALRTLDVTVLGFTYLQDRPGAEMAQVLDECAAGRLQTDLLVVEGATYRSPAQPGTWASCMPLVDRIRAIAPVAEYTVAVGTCACFGGLMACGRNVMGATGLQYFREEKGGVLGTDYRSRGGLPVVNVPGCPAHPDWIIGTLWALRAGRLGDADLDRFNRPRMFYGELAHHACPRNEYYEFKASAITYGEQGCLFENLGCKGTLCESDCNERLWLSRTGSCTRGGFPCLSCTSPRFPDGFVPFFETSKIGGIPTSLPLDVPKAWYVAISGLSKLACPERLRTNAVSSRPMWPPKEELPEDGDKDDHV